LGAGCGAAEPVTIPPGGIFCPGGPAVAAGVRGAVLIPCDRSRRDAWIGQSLLSSAKDVGRVTTMDCMVASWVVIVSSCLVMDPRAISERQRNGMRMDSPLDRPLSCLWLGMGIWSGEKRSLSCVS